MKEKISPSRRWYLLALLITFLGPIFGIYSIISILSSPAKIDIPLQQIGVNEITIKKTGVYTLWVKPQTKMAHTFMLRYNFGGDNEETQIEPYTFTHKQTNKSAIVTKTPPFPIVNWFKIQRSQVKIPIANVELLKKGIYITKLSSTELPLSISLGYPSIDKIYHHIMINIALIFSTIIIGPLLAIGILIARNSARKTISNLEISEKGQSENLVAALCHASGFTLFLYPFGHIISPLFIWLFFKDQYPAVYRHGKAVLNFQISMSIYYIVLAILVFFIIGIPLIILLFLYHIFAMLIGVIVAAQGKAFRYPLSIPFIV